MEVEDSLITQLCSFLEDDSVTSHSPKRQIMSFVADFFFLPRPLQV